ncbi:hypothetical protein TNCV_2817361 [Trichonephila clavipes]|nr:hypothetical protein TNCV_2817361 [Trichonephila clavipes]
MEALLQTASNATSGHWMMRNRLNLLIYGSGCGCPIHHCTIRDSSRAVVQRSRCDWFHGFLLHPAMTDPHHNTVAWFRPTR